MMNPSDTPPGRIARWPAFFAVLAVALTIIALQAWWGWKDIRQRRAITDEKYPPTVQWTQPRTMASFADVDGNFWFLYARQMLTEGRWRVHETQLDNTPHGRGVHWSSSWSWWMILLAKSRALISGGTALDHLAWAADFSEAFLHALGRRLNDAYPARGNVTVFPMPRLFFVATI